MLFNTRKYLLIPSKNIANLDYCGIEVLNKNGRYDFSEINLVNSKPRKCYSTKHMSHFIKLGSMIYMNGDFQLLRRNDKMKMKK